jgi:hypothetical protein
MLRRYRKNITGALLILMFCTCPFVYIRSQTLKISKIQLEDYGWQAVPNHRELFGHHALTSNLWLDHDNRVLVGFTVREGYALATREYPGRTFHIVRFTPDGKRDLMVTLPTDSWYTNGFYLTPHDHILARANDTLQFFLKDGSNEQSGTWQPLVACPESCIISQSFSRRTLLVGVHPIAGHGDVSAYTIVDASTFPPRVVRTCPAMASMMITDKFTYRVEYDRDDDLTVRYPFCDVEHYEDFPMWGKGGYILNDEMLFKFGSVKGGRFTAQLVESEGQVKFSMEMPKHDSIDPYKIMTDDRHQRIAFMVNSESGAHPGLDIGGRLVARRVVVVDETGKLLASIPTDTHYHIDSNFSLSPDGRHLAILDEGVVTVVELQ